MSFLFALVAAVSLVVGYLSQVDLRILSEVGVQAPSGSDVVRFYDAVGGILMNDVYHNTFEAMAMKDMLAHCDLGAAENVLEIGPGSGFLADLMLETFPDVRYTGVDLSETLKTKAAERLAKHVKSGRAELLLVKDSFEFLNTLKEPVDRYVFTYVLDLLPSEDITRFVQLLQEKLRHHSNAKVCVANLTYGYTPLSRIVTNLWQLIYRTLGGAAVGGCRPFQILDYFPQRQGQGQGGWRVEYVNRVVSTGLPSEVAVLSFAA